MRLLPLLLVAFTGCGSSEKEAAADPFKAAVRDFAKAGADFCRIFDRLLPTLREFDRYASDVRDAMAKIPEAPTDEAGTMRDKAQTLTSTLTVLRAHLELETGLRSSPLSRPDSLFGSVDRVRRDFETLGAWAK